MIVRIVYTLPPGKRFRPDAFDASIGKSTPVRFGHTHLPGTLLAAVLGDDRGDVLLILEVADTALAASFGRAAWLTRTLPKQPR